MTTIPIEDMDEDTLRSMVTGYQRRYRALQVVLREKTAKLAELETRVAQLEVFVTALQGGDVK